MVDAYPKTTAKTNCYSQTRVNAWIKNKSEELAINQVINRLEGIGWLIGEIIDVNLVTKKSYENNPEGRELFEQARADGEVYYQHSIERFSIDEYGEISTRIEPDEIFFKEISSISLRKKIWTFGDHVQPNYLVINEQPTYPIFLTKRKAEFWKQKLHLERGVFEISFKVLKNQIIEKLNEDNALLIKEYKKNISLVSFSCFHLLNCS